MRKTTLFISAMLIGIEAMFCATSVFSMDSNESAPITVRKRNPIPGSDNNVPRSLSIEAYYDSENFCVYASLNDMGTWVDVYIQNLDTEEQLYYQIPGNGNAILPISGSSGNWTITFLLSNGDEYVGEFYL